LIPLILSSAICASSNKNKSTLNEYLFLYNSGNRSGVNTNILLDVFNMFIFSTKLRIKILLSSLKVFRNTAIYSAINALEGTTITTSFLYFFNNSLNKNDFPVLVGAENE